MKRTIRVLISGGGTGGHIFPAISIANAIKVKCPDAEILFVGADNRMEMEKVPAAGYPIKGLPVSGFNRSNPLANFKVLWRLWRSLRMARRIVRDFRPDVAVGVGGICQWSHFVGRCASRCTYSHSRTKLLCGGHE